MVLEIQKTTCLVIMVLSGVTSFTSYSTSFNFSDYYPAKRSGIKLGRSVFNDVRFYPGVWTDSVG